jgi:hypothetical protein
LTVTGDSIQEQNVETIAPASERRSEKSEALASWVVVVRVVGVFVVVQAFIVVLVFAVVFKFLFCGGMTEVAVTTDLEELIQIHPSLLYKG